MKQWIVIAKNYSMLDHYGPFESHVDAVKFFKKLPDEDFWDDVSKSIWELKDPDEILSYPITLEIENV
jgi:hypothetical protein